uniref:Dynamin-type G domain-containing protein n=1 Tax=Acrobeloides nanus TaxID=290746 RepID=A0A914DSF8_9BILA
MLLLLAFDRFIILCFQTKSIRIIEGRPIKFLIGIAWLWGLSFGTVEAVILAFVYNIEIGFWLPTNQEIDDFVGKVEMYIILTQLVLAFLMYLCAVTRLIFLKKHLYEIKDYKSEIRLLIQAIIVTTMELVGIIYWTQIAFNIDIEIGAFTDMDDLIAKINKIRDAFKTVDVPPEIQLPQFVVVGAQSAGKSSVLEAIVRRDFLPRGEDIVTRTPLELRLVYTPENDPNRKSPEDYAVFDHKKEEHFTNFNQVRDEIERKTNELAGNAKSKIVKLINKYIQNEKTLILVVTQATSELQTSEALKLAREVDPEGRRTLVVVTHIDRVNPGNDVVGMLAGKKIPNKLGIIGVKLRNNKEIKDNKTIEACINDETLFWQKSYQKIASKNGVPYLSTRLNEGVYNPFFIPEETFKKLVEGSVERLKVHCLDCTEQVYDELKKTARECYEEINLKHKRFPELCYQIHEVISNLIISQREPTKKFLTQLVETGYAFINTDNPDLYNDELKKFLADPLNNMAFFAKNGNENFLKRFGDELNCISLTEYGHSEDPLSKKRLKFTMNAEVYFL